jgi:hypothetical protein
MMRRTRFWKTDWFLDPSVSGCLPAAAGCDLIRGEMARASRACLQHEGDGRRGIDIQ